MSHIGQLKPAILCVGLLLGAHGADAHENPESCAEAATTLAINSCLEERLKVIEARLDVAYRVLIERLQQLATAGEDVTETRRQVAEAQAAWRTFRRADCEAKYAIHASGTIRTVIFLGCMIEHTQQRIAALETFTAL